MTTNSSNSGIRDLLAGVVRVYNRNGARYAEWEPDTRAALDAAVNVFGAYLVATGEHSNQSAAVDAITAEIEAPAETAPVVFHIDEIEGAFNAAADLVADAINADGDCPEHDAIELTTNAAVTRLGAPDATFDDVVTNSRSETPEEVRAWWGHWN